MIKSRMNKSAIELANFEAAYAPREACDPVTVEVFDSVEVRIEDESFEVYIGKIYIEDEELDALRKQKMLMLSMLDAEPLENEMYDAVESLCNFEFFGGETYNGWDFEEIAEALNVSIDLAVFNTLLYAIVKIEMALRLSL